MERVAIIPCRGGSKRLPRKNVMPVLGRPMLSYPVTAALKSGVFDAVTVSTEDEEIAKVAHSVGARVIKRPGELAGDRATVVEVCLHALDRLREENRLPDYFCCIYATALFVRPDDLRKSFRLLQNEPEADFVMGVSQYNLQPVQALVEKDGYLTPMWPQYVGVQSQFQPHLVASNGTLYWARVSVFMEAKSFYGRKLRGYFIPKSRAVDIDTLDDLRLAEILSPHILSVHQE